MKITDFRESTHDDSSSSTLWFDSVPDVSKSKTKLYNRPEIREIVKNHVGDIDYSITSDERFISPHDLHVIGDISEDVYGTIVFINLSNLNPFVTFREKYRPLAEELLKTITGIGLNLDEMQSAYKLAMSL
jgi:hypothetical protein